MPHRNLASYRCFVAVILLLCGCEQPVAHTVSPAAARANSSLGQPLDGPATARFAEVGRTAGLDYCWTIPGKRPLNILQTIGNGCAFLDYDQDGNLDILLVGPDHIALYRGNGHGHFTDVSHETGLDRLRGHFLGCAVGDYDNDGFPDIYLTAYHGGALLHNEQG